MTLAWIFSVCPALFIKVSFAEYTTLGLGIYYQIKTGVQYTPADASGKFSLQTSRGLSVNLSKSWCENKRKKMSSGKECIATELQK